MVSVLIVVYSVCLAIGALYLLFSAIMGEFAAHFDVAGVDHAGPEVGHVEVGGGEAADVGAPGGEIGEIGHVAVGHEVEIGHPVEVGTQHLSVMSPPIMASFLTAFGGMGLLGKLLIGFGSLGSFAFAASTGLVIAVLMYIAVERLLYSMAASSEATVREILGAQAEVLTSVPENGVGEIAYTCKGFRYTAPARSYDGQPVPRGARVRIVKTDGCTMTIKQF
jgi:membrane protein implicated in regulation of membrane protease activity